MRQPRRRARHGRRPVITVLAVTLGSLAVLLPATVGGARSALAAPAAGYTASLIPTGLDELLVAVDPASSAVYLVASTDTLTVVDGTTNTVTTTIGLPAGPRGIAVDPVTDTIYVSVSQTTTSQPAVDVIDGATNTVTHTIPLPAGSVPTGVAVDSSTDKVYVAEQGAAAVAVIDGSSDAVTATVSTSGIGVPFRLAVDEASDVIWTGTANGFLVAIDGASNTVGQPIALPLVRSLAVNPVSDTVYTATNAGIDVIDGATGAITTTIGITGTGPVAVAVDQGSGTVFASTYQGSSGSGTTWVINGSSNAIVDIIERGGVQIAVDTATGAAYEAPSVAQGNAAWVLTPSATDAWSPVIKSTAATFTVGTAGSLAITGTALPAATYSETGQLPSGVTLSAAGTMSGTPAAGTGGVYPIAITASNGIPPDYSQAFTLTVDEVPSLTAPAPATFRVGTSVSIPIAATGYPAPSVGASNLPAGLAVTQQGPGQWELTGTPAVGSGGVYNVDFNATNAVGRANSTVPITVQEAPSFTSAPATTFLTDSNNNYIASVDGYPAVTLTTTGIPAWLHLDTGGLLWGDPPATAAGVYRFTITASNSLGSATQAFTLSVTQPVAIGVEGSNGQLWAHAPQLGLGWHTLGGKITAPPAVAAQPNPNGTSPVSPVFIATGTDKHLYIRSLTAGWEELGPSTASCLGAPAATITGTAPGGPFTLTVACRGLDSALWENSATMPATGLPRFTSNWKSLGGVLSAGPAAAPVNGTMTFFVRGTNGRTYTRTPSAGYKATTWVCIGQPAAASQAASGVTLFACQGGNHALFEAAYGAGRWYFTGSMGGSLIGGPAVAATSLATYLIAEGTDHAVWDRIDSGGGWMSIGTTAVGGVGAVALN